MKVYEIHYDNMEPYEDNFNRIECICATYDKAVEYLVNNGIVKKDGDITKTDGAWVEPEYVCSMNNIDCEDCTKYYNGDNYDGSTFIDEYSGNETSICPEIQYKFESLWNHPQWTIVEWEVIE